MPNQPLSLAKLTRPRLHGVVARERLFTMLDAARNRPAVCVVGPPGAGKTTLVASWLDARAIKGIWYQVDSGDGDAATLFHYLGLAAVPFTRKGQRKLPALEPAYLQDVPAFARRFFRELFSRLPEGAALVLDNYQEIDPDNQAHEIVSSAVDELPPGRTLIAISRRDPPSHYARLIANRNVAPIDADALKLTLNEVEAIVLARGEVAPGAAAALHARSGGWAAGLTLLLEQHVKDPRLSEPSEPISLDTVFDYFAGQIFDRLDGGLQRFLTAVGFLPRVAPSIAYQLTGNAQAADILDDLYRRHLFVDRRGGVEVAYQFHALFQTFLRARAAKLLTPGQQQELVSKAARLLETRNYDDDAFGLYREASDWDAAGRLILKRARALLAQGRGQTLREWIGALPGEHLDRRPMLRYWLGASLIEVDQPLAREQLTLAFAALQRAEDTLGATLAACGVIDTYYFEWSEWGLMPGWIAQIEALLAAAPVLDAPETELHVYSRLMIAMLYAQPGHPMLPFCVQRVMEMLALDIDVNQRMAAATFLLSYCTITNELERGREVAVHVQPLLAHPDVTPLNGIWWRTRLGYFLWNTTEYEASLAVLDEAGRLTEVHGLAGLRAVQILALTYRTLSAVTTGNLALAQTCYRRREELLTRGKAGAAWQMRFGQLQLAMGRGDYRYAFEHGSAAVEAQFARGMIYTQALTLIAEAYGHAEFGTHEKVLDKLARARALVQGTCFAHLEAEIELAEAYSLLAHGDTACGREKLRCAMVEARRRGYTYHMRWCSKTLPRICAEALQAGFEVDYARELVHRYRVRPPAPAPAAWPWPIKVCTLGGFELALDGRPVEFSGKTPRKPLLLLKALIAFGGQDVPSRKLIDALWPDEEGDAGERALGVTLVRLRKLLGQFDALSVTDERVSLRAAVCWVDAFEFEASIKGAGAGRASPSASTSEDAVEHGVALYAGTFLPAEADTPWTVQARLRLRASFTRAVEDLAERRELAGQWDEAIALYRRGIEADDLVEDFYLGLMRCYRALNRPSDGIAVFRRLRQTLSVVLGVTPSPASEDLARALREGAPPSAGKPSQPSSPAS